MITRSYVHRITALAMLMLAVLVSPGPSQAQSEAIPVDTPGLSKPRLVPDVAMERFLDVAVSPRETTYVGEVQSEGYTRMMLSFAGEVPESPQSGVQIGALLVPVEDFVTRAMGQRDNPFALEAKAFVEVKGESGLFAAEPLEAPVAFPRYAVYIYNTGPSPVKANLYVYLTR